MVYFGIYLKDYLEFNNISQSEFAVRLGISKKHMNEVLNGKASITLEMAANIERLTGISSNFIIKIENERIISQKLLDKYSSEKNIKKVLKDEYSVNELKNRKWLVFKDETNAFQIAMDLLDFLKVKDFDVLDRLEEKTLFKKKGNDFKKLSLWIARCDELCLSQKVDKYVSDNFENIVLELKKHSYKKGIDMDGIRKILNKYGVFFVYEKALPGTKVRGCFKVKLNQPAIYITSNYASKGSLYFELFHELGHMKSDFNEAKSKVIVEGNDLQEKRADEFAINAMINEKVWEKIIQDMSIDNLQKISRENRIPMSFIVSRLANLNLIEYNSKLYLDNYLE